MDWFISPLVRPLKRIIAQKHNQLRLDPAELACTEKNRKPIEKEPAHWSGVCPISRKWLSRFECRLEIFFKPLMSISLPKQGQIRSTLRLASLGTYLNLAVFPVKIHAMSSFLQRHCYIKGRFLEAFLKISVHLSLNAV